jgi:cell fate regulator YaaT (PSP1 superfamily)
MAYTYLVRYGLMSHVGRFAAEADGLERGETVVVRSARGVELGAVLLRLEGADAPSNGSDAAPGRLLRAASGADLERARQVERERPDRFRACERVFRQGLWPLEVIDVEPLLEGRRTVLHYLGPHHLDAAGLVQMLRDDCGLDIWLEPAGRDAPAEEAFEATHDDAAHGCSSCGGSGGGCGEGGGCGSKAGSESGGGCSGCGVKELIAAGRRRSR